MTPTPENQPDGIDEQSLDLPTPENAADRVAEFLRAHGDGLIEAVDSQPLYARDLEVLSRQPAELEVLRTELAKTSELLRGMARRQVASRTGHDDMTVERDRLGAKLAIAEAELAAERETIGLMGRDINRLDAVTAERDALRAQLAGMEAEVDQRDEAQDWADKLAYAIAPQSAIGEHSNNNNPWANALEIATQRPAETPAPGWTPMSLDRRDFILVDSKAELTSEQRAAQDSLRGPDGQFRDEFGEYLAEARKDPEFNEAFEKAAPEPTAEAGPEPDLTGLAMEEDTVPSDGPAAEASPAARERLTPGGFPYRQFPHQYAGSNTERQQVGDPGHCEDCVSVGHVVAHPGLGCGDVGCEQAHGDGSCVPCWRPGADRR